MNPNELLLPVALVLMLVPIVAQINARTTEYGQVEISEIEDTAADTESRSFGSPPLRIERIRHRPGPVRSP